MMKTLRPGMKVQHVVTDDEDGGLMEVGNGRKGIVDYGFSEDDAAVSFYCTEEGVRATMYPGHLKIID